MALFGSCYGERWSSVFSFLVCFLFVFYLTGGRLVLRHIGVFGSLSCVPVCFSLSFVFLPSEARRLFFWSVAGGIRLVRARKKLLSDLFWSSIVYCSFRNLRP